MRTIRSFNFVTLNGYFEGPEKGQYAWHSHQQSSEETEYAEDNLQHESILLLGRVTYDQMAGFWPTEQALQLFPEVAKGMNKAEKIVFSNTLKETGWDNTRIISGDIFEEVRKLKALPGKDMTILGSGSIVKQFAGHGLIDEFQLMIDPVVIGSGTNMFEDFKGQLNLRLTSTKTFKDGVVVLKYEPA